MPSGDVSLRLWPAAPLLVAIGVQPMWAVILHVPTLANLFPDPGDRSHAPAGQDARRRTKHPGSGSPMAIRRGWHLPIAQPPWPEADADAPDDKEDNETLR
jgi:hypothetical protein